MYIGELAAITAALCWSFGGFAAAGPARALGPIPFNRLFMGLTSLMLIIATCFTGGFATITLEAAGLLFISSFFGIFLGDTVLFTTMNRVGPRRCGILFSCNAPITALFGFLFLNETLSLLSALGCILTVTGVMMAVYFRTEGKAHALEEVQGSLTVGVLLGLLAALLQAIGSLIVKPVLDGGVDPMAAAAFRTCVAFLLLSATFFSKNPRFCSKTPYTLKLVAQTGLAGLLGMALGMTFLLYGFAHGNIGIIATLSSLSPVLTLPILWAITKRCPNPGAWVGAFVAVIGTGLIFLYK